MMNWCSFQKHFDSMIYRLRPVRPDKVSLRIGIPKIHPPQKKKPLAVPTRCFCRWTAVSHSEFAASFLGPQVPIISCKKLSRQTSMSTSAKVGEVFFSVWPLGVQISSFGSVFGWLARGSPKVISEWDSHFMRSLLSLSFVVNRWTVWFSTQN